MRSRYLTAILADGGPWLCREGAGRPPGPSDSDTAGLRLGDCQTLPPLDDFIDAVIERYDSDGAIRVDSGTINRDWEAVIRNGVPAGERSELFQGAVWHLPVADPAARAKRSAVCWALAIAASRADLIRCPNLETS
jgi:hypothetical protein